MSKIKGFLVVVAVVAMVFTLSCSSSSDSEAILPSSPSGNGNISTCNGKEYDTTVYSCERGELVGSCRGNNYYIEYEYCDNGVIKDLLGNSSSSSAVSSSSSVVPSSSSALPSSSSAEPSSSSAVPSSSSSSGGIDTPTITTFVDNRDGKTYKKVTIGTQVWMAENLNYAVGGKCYGEGWPVRYENGYGTNTKTLSGKEIQDNCATYGRLYNWATAMNIETKYNSSWWDGNDANHQGICPSGWRLPSNEDWDRLFRYVDGSSGTSSPYSSSPAGKHLKASTNWDTYEGFEGIENLDTYGFSALPGGHGDPDDGYNGLFSTVGYSGIWWSASKGEGYINNDAYNRSMVTIYNGAGWGKAPRSNLLSVRCLKN